MNWDEWVIDYNKSKPNDAGGYLLDIRGTIHRKLDPGHEVIEVRHIIPVFPEANVSEIVKKFQKDLETQLKGK